MHHHELAHEWWGNLITNASWEGMWLHEGFGQYMQPLYTEHLGGEQAYLDHMMRQRGNIGNRKAMSPDSVLSVQEIYAGHDIYTKGSWVLHTLRFLVGDETFFEILRRQAYPDPALEAVTDGSQVRFGTTADFIALASGHAGQDLGWFFDVYARQPKLPSVESVREGNRLILRWAVADTDLPFPMPLDIEVDGQRQRVEMPDGSAVITVAESADVRIDPDNRILREGNLEGNVAR